MLKIRNKFFTFNEDEKEYREYLSIWNKETEVHFFGTINKDYEKNLEEKLVWLEKNRLPIIDKFIQEDNAFNSINQMIENKEIKNLGKSCIIAGKNKYLSESFNIFPIEIASSSK